MTNNNIYTDRQILNILKEYDREFKLDTFAYTRACSFTVEEWWNKKVENMDEDEYKSEKYGSTTTSTILITPVDNIKNKQVLDNNLIQERIYYTNMDVFIFYNTVRGSLRSSTLMNVSLYDDLIVENGIKYSILKMLTK